MWNKSPIRAMFHNKPHNICHSEGSHSCSRTHIVLRWGQSHCCIHTLLHKVCCSSEMQEGQCRLLDKHWCMDCNDYWEGTQQLRKNKKHCINNDSPHKTTKPTWNHYSIPLLFWDSGNCGGFLKLEIPFLLYNQKEEKKIEKENSVTVNCCILAIKHFQIQGEAKPSYIRSCPWMLHFHM